MTWTEMMACWASGRILDYCRPISLIRGYNRYLRTVPSENSFRVDPHQYGCSLKGRGIGFLDHLPISLVPREIRVDTLIHQILILVIMSTGQIVVVGFRAPRTKWIPRPNIVGARINNPPAADGPIRN